MKQALFLIELSTVSPELPPADHKLLCELELSHRVFCTGAEDLTLDLLLWNVQPELGQALMQLFHFRATEVEVR